MSAGDGIIKCTDFFVPMSQIVSEIEDTRIISFVMLRRMVSSEAEIKARTDKKYNKTRHQNIVPSGKWTERATEMACYIVDKQDVFLSGPSEKIRFKSKLFYFNRESSQYEQNGTIYCTIRKYSW